MVAHWPDTRNESDAKYWTIRTRGGVEDTRLEAKAKDTKKIRGQGQGQPFRGQTLSRPRTGMLEAKAKDQGHKRKCSPKKKSLHKNFSSDLQKKGLHKNLSSDLHKKYVFQKIFQALHKILTIQKIVLSSSREQANFRGLEASRPRPRTSKCVLEAKDVLEDSTSDQHSIHCNDYFVLGRICTCLRSFSDLCSCGFFEFLTTEFAMCSKPPSRFNYRKASYPRSQQANSVTRVRVELY